MKKIKLILIVFLLSGSYLPVIAQTWEWATSIASNNSLFAINSYGETFVYADVFGRIKGLNQNKVLPQGGIFKLNSSGELDTFIEIRSSYKNSWYIGAAIYCTSNYIYLAASRVFGSYIIGNKYYLNSVDSTKYYESIIIKFDRDLNVIWKKTIGYSSINSRNWFDNLLVDSKENIYLVGQASDPVIFYDTFVPVLHGMNFSAYLIKISNDSVSWFRLYGDGSNGNQVIQVITFDDVENLIYGVFWEGNVYKISANNILLASGSIPPITNKPPISLFKTLIYKAKISFLIVSDNFYLVKCNLNFKQWEVKTLNNFNATALIQTNDTSIYLAGVYNKNFSINSFKFPDQDTFTPVFIKLDTNFNVKWYYCAKATYWYNGFMENSDNDPAGNIYFNGYYKAAYGGNDYKYYNIKFDKYLLSDNEYSLYFIAKLNPDSLYFNYKFGCGFDSLINKSSSVYDSFQWTINNKTYMTYPKSNLSVTKYKGEIPIKLIGYKRNKIQNRFLDTITLQNLPQPKANFYTDSFLGCQWVGFHFYDSTMNKGDLSNISQSWLWDFGDGTFNTRENPSHIYTKAGLYNVKLIYSNGYCDDSIIKPQAVQILAAPKPGFTLNNDNFCTPFTLKIKDASIGAVTSWYYTLGDGRIDTTASPIINYTIPGTYLIIQTLTGPTGCITSDSAWLFLRKGFDVSEQVNSYTVNVQAVNRIVISWESLPDAYSYKINRQSDAANINYNNPATTTCLTDTLVSTTGSIYSYTIYGVDSCGKLSGPSRYLRNILLTGISTANDMTVIKWNPFEQWQNGVKEYMIEVYDILSDNFTQNQTTTNTEFTDLAFSDSSNSAVEKCYRIKAYEMNGNNMQSVSNVLCLPFQPMIWIPNSFSPNNDKLNDIFKPVCLGMTEYNLKIYNRWGVLIFSTQKQEIGWDGSVNGRLSEPAMYFYSLRVKGKNSEARHFSGELYLLK